MAESPTQAPRRGWSWHRIATLLVLLLIAPQLAMPGGLTGEAPPAYAIALGMLLGHGGWLAILLVALGLQVGWRGMTAELGLRRLTRLDLRLVLRTVAMVVPLVWLLLIVSTLLWRWLGFPESPNPLIEWLGSAPSQTVATIVLAAVVVAPVVEEAVFRVAFFRTASAHLPEELAALVVSLAFALSHGLLVQVPALMALALVLQEVLRRSGNLWVPILVHALFNGVMVGLTLLARAALPQ